LTRPRHGTHAFQYEPQWIQSEAARVLSLSLPFTPGNVPHKGATVANFFDNLLPDNEAIRSRIRSKFSAPSADPFDLLTAIGRDCVGAVQLLPEGNTPTRVDRIDAIPLSEADVEHAITASLSGSRVVGQELEEDFRISLAGAQEKTALLFHRGRWSRPRGSTPTTHILKLPLGFVGNLQADMSDSVENEWLCSQIMRAFGIATASCEIAQFGARKVLVVERFDRARQPGGWIARLPQEDFCQALGLPAAQRYESDGGPGMRDILRVLDASANAAADKETFVRAQIVFWMLAATDGHAKNFSIFHERGGTYRLTPLYDILSTWPIVGRGRNKLDYRKLALAMAVRSKNAHWKLSDIRPRHWDAVAKQAGLSDADRILHELAQQAPRVVTQVASHIPPGFPAQVSDTILRGLEKNA
jgi:serine/threonine-protein kinase HipA